MNLQYGVVLQGTADIYRAFKFYIQALTRPVADFNPTGEGAVECKGDWYILRPAGENDNLIGIILQQHLQYGDNASAHTLKAGAIG